MFSNVSFSSYGLYPLLPPSIVSEGLKTLNSIRHRIVLLSKSCYGSYSSMEQLDTKLNQTMEILGLCPLTPTAWKEIVKATYVSPTIISEQYLMSTESFSFASLRNNKAATCRSFHCFQPKRSFSTYHYSHRNHILTSHSFLSNCRTVPGYYRYISEHHLQQLEERANSEYDSTIAQKKYLRAVLEQDPAYVVRRFESGKYAVDSDVRSVYLEALDMLNMNKQASEEDGSSQGGAPDKGTKSNPMVVSVIPQKSFMSEFWSVVRFSALAFIIISLFSSSVITKIRSGANSMMSDYQPSMGDKSYTFNDVQGVDEAKEELYEVVEFLKNPEKFQKLGAKLPRGILLVGPPGTGKTLLAKAIAGEADVPFFFCSGSEFDEMFVGVGASRVRQLFGIGKIIIYHSAQLGPVHNPRIQPEYLGCMKKARKRKPCVVFIDELDAVGGARVASALHPYSRMTLNQLLVEMDGFKELEGIIVIGATNFPESLDKALIRAGRFDTRINTTLPDVRARHKILEVHASKVKLHEEVSLETVARTTSGFSGADLANLVNQAALRGSADGKDAVTMRDFDWARDKIIMGAERKSAVIQEENRRLVAYHEAGHAVVALCTPGAMKVYKATIVPRGSALGMVAQLPEKDELQWSRKQLLARLDVAMGGRVAEEMVFGAENVTSGASSDVEMASRLARAMVTKYAMSDVIGPVAPLEDDKTSPEMANLIEQEVKRFTKEAYDRAKHVLQTHSVEHGRLAEALLKYETLDLEEIKLVIKGKPLNRTL